MMDIDLHNYPSNLTFKWHYQVFITPRFYFILTSIDSYLTFKAKGGRGLVVKKNKVDFSSIIEAKLVDSY